MSQTFFGWAAFVMFMVYYLLVVTNHLFLALISFFENEKRTKEDAREEYRALSESSFTVPVSIIIPAHNEEVWIKNAVQAVLNLDYPQFELIVVDDGSTDRTLDELKKLLDLKPSGVEFVDRFDAGRIREIFVSRLHPNVTVISKDSGHKKAGALNAALNLAHYKYVCTIDADQVLEPHALLKVMSHVQRDPEHVVGVGSYFALANELKIKDGRVREKTFSQKPIIAYQNLEYIRAFIGNRVAWSRLNCTPIVSGGFGVWRRDVLRELGGFDRRASAEDLEFTFRVQDYIVKNKKLGYKIMMLPYLVGWTEGPNTVRSLILQRNRWQRTTNEAVALYKHMFFNPKYGYFAFMVFPYFVFYEVLGVFFETASLVFIFLGWITGSLNFEVFLSLIIFMVLVQAILSLLALFIFNRHQRLLNFRETAYFILLCFTEFIWYRAIISVARIGGTLDYLRGVRTQNKVARIGAGPQ